MTFKVPVPIETSIEEPTHSSPDPSLDINHIKENTSPESTYLKYKIQRKSTMESSKADLLKRKSIENETFYFLSQINIDVSLIMLTIYNEYYDEYEMEQLIMNESMNDIRAEEKER